MKTLLFFLLSVFASAPASEPASVVKDVTPKEALHIMVGKAPVFVLDVRTPDEFAQGHMPGAVNVDFMGDDFGKLVSALKSGGRVIVHCASGNRSSQAIPKIAALKKFDVIYHLKAGFSGWKAAGLPVETKPAAK